MIIGKGGFTDELPGEFIAKKVCGPSWRSLPPNEIDAAWGMLIVRSVLDGAIPRLHGVASFLGVDVSVLKQAFIRLEENGVFHGGMLERDRNLLDAGDELAWGFIGGYAAGATARMW